MSRVVPVIILLLSLVAAAFGSSLPTSTTMTAQTGNNTSTANTFASAADGNLGASNISKVPLRTLLYPGATTKLYAHVEPWWGSASHIDIGYSSQDPNQIKRQISDMISRGLDGLAVDWYGPGSYEDLPDKLLLTEVEQHPGFKMFIEIDHGAIEWHSCWKAPAPGTTTPPPGACDGTTAAIQLFTAAASTFFSSPSYVKMGGRPVVREFGMENYGIDWNAVQAKVPGNPLIVHRNNQGFTDPQTGGVFGWIEPIAAPNVPPGYDGMDYVDGLYAKATRQYPAVTMFATVFKGFNDIAAHWSPPGGRHVEQNCGQTFLRSFKEINKFYSAANQLPALQLVTWNDYEEGTEMETGIDTCVSVSGSVSGNTLQWTITGDESTVDHYTIYASADGQNLAPLGDIAAGTHSRDLSGIPAGTYLFFVQAIGKPMLKNQMSDPISYTSANTNANWNSVVVGKAISISATPGSASVTGGQAAQFQLAVAQIGAADQVNLSCGNLPANMTCAFTTAALTPKSTPVAVGLTVSTSPATAALHPTAAPRRGLPAFAFWMSSLGLVGMVGLPPALRRNRRTLLLIALLLAIALLATACGGGGAGSQFKSDAVSPSSAAGGTYTITVNAASGPIVSSTNVTLTVR